MNRPPTAEEIRWMRRLESVLLTAPPHIGILTQGDAFLMIYDAIEAKQYAYMDGGGLHDGGADRRGLVIGRVRSAVPIEGVSG